MGFYEPYGDVQRLLKIIEIKWAGRIWMTITGMNDFLILTTSMHDINQTNDMNEMKTMDNEWMNWMNEWIDWLIEWMNAWTNERIECT